MENTFKSYSLENDIQLLLDNEFLDDYWLLRRVPELPVKSYYNPVLYDDPPYSPGGCTVLYDKEDKIFKCWYGIADSKKYYARQPGAYRMCYAVSEYGIKWEKPKLGIIEDRGTRENNIIFNNPGCVNKDYYEQDPKKRYKMLYISEASGSHTGLCAAFSPDGIHWHKNGGKDVEIIPGANDTNNMAYYDPSIKKYVRFGRVNVISAVENERNFGITMKCSEDIIRYRDTLGLTRIPKSKFPDYDDFIEYNEAEHYINNYLHIVPYEHAKYLRIGSITGCNRRIVRSESDDFLNWTIPELVIAPDELDTPRFYGITTCIYQGMYIGLLQVLNSSGNKRYMGNIRNGEGDTIDVQLAFSRDGIRWERLANRPNFIPRGYIGSYDGGMILGSNIPIIEYGDDFAVNVK
ncbi:MAG: hypothetical protein GX754_03425 [Clostridiaceae bacterium]|nr:hypothetical protein [Clostridiaceae bacterium]